jgi:pimeloyl-ACP methyl ester carboxylesterase
VADRGPQAGRSRQPPAPADRYLPVTGALLRYRGEGRGPPVPLIHGWTLDLEMWEPPRVKPLYCSANILCRAGGQPATLLALRVLLYGSDGSLKREFSRRQIVFRGSALSVIFRGHADERYLVVASDPAAVGHQLSQVRDVTQGTMMAAYPFYFYVYSGTDATLKNILSQNGRVTVSLRPLPAN